MQRIECPRCGAMVDLYGADRIVNQGGEHREVHEGARLRAHKDPLDRRSCWAGGKLVSEIDAAIRAHRERQREATLRAARNI